MASPTIQRIAQLNDAFRRGDPSVPGQRFLTAGVVHLLKQNQLDADGIAQIIIDFNDFTEDNGPHGEHDFGSFSYLGQTCFWKIDCYDTEYSMGSDDPTDLRKTRRVLTIMLVGEW